MEKIEKLKQLLTEADTLAKELANDKQHSGSTLIVPIRNRIAAALSSIPNHVTWLSKQTPPAAKTK